MENHVIQNRYDFLLLFDVEDGNPNGDPDAGNLPRLDVETGNGLITDVCLKRKIRNFVALAKGDNSPYEIYVKEKAILNKQHERAYTALGKEPKDAKSEDRELARTWMCQNFYDIRAFGAVMTTGVNCGQVKGPIQMTFSRSIDPIVSAEHSITRMAVTTEKEAEAQHGDNRTMGRKFTIPYGLYLGKGFISQPFADKTGFSTTDLALFFEALQLMFEHDRSAARGQMSTRKLLIFEHASNLGNAPAQVLFEKLAVTRNNPSAPARHYSDYSVSYNGNPLSADMVETYSVNGPDAITRTTNPIWKQALLTSV